MLTLLLGAHDPLDHVVQHAPDWATIGSGPFGFTLFSNHIFMQWVAAALIVWLLPMAIRSWTTQGGPIPGVGNAIEAICLALRDHIFRPSLGNYTDLFSPYLWSLFFFLLVSNVLGLIPLSTWFSWVPGHVIGGTSTGNIAVTATLALSTLGLVVINGLRFNGMAYVAHFFMGPWYMSWFIAILEVFGLGFKTLALAVRLFANMLAGHIILAVLMSFIPMAFGALPAAGAWGITGAVIIGSVLFNLLEVFVAFLHAFIFTTLTAVFIGLAVNIHHDEHHEEEHAHAEHGHAHAAAH